MCPKNNNNTHVSKINELGELISNKRELRSLYVKTYKDRLSQRSIGPEYEQLKDMKNNLFIMSCKIVRI